MFLVFIIITGYLAYQLLALLLPVGVYGFMSLFDNVNETIGIMAFIVFLHILFKLIDKMTKKV